MPSTQYISLATFTIEFLFAIYFLLKNPKDKLNRILAVLSFFLGLYQLNEFLICITTANFFTRGAMIATAVLPAIGVSYALIMWRKKLAFHWHLLIYSPAVFFITMFSLPLYYKNNAVCDTVFVEYPSIGLLSKFYALYYMLYIATLIILFYLAASHTENKFNKRLLHLGALGIISFTLPTFIFLQFLPNLYVKFPSVYCQFGFILAVELIVVIWYKDKHKIKF